MIVCIVRLRSSPSPFRRIPPGYHTEPEIYHPLDPEHARNIAQAYEDMVIKMGKVTHKGWSTSSDEIPQPISIVTGQNLRQNSQKPSKSSNEKDEEEKPQR